MKRWLTILGMALAILVGCDNSSVTGPSPPPPPPPPVDPEPPSPPPFNPGSPFGFTGTRGILVFPGTQATETDIRALHNRARAAGFPRITWHACAETVEWEGTPWLDFTINGGPDDVYTRENLQNLINFLTVTADLGDQVIMDVFCTVRDNHKWMEAQGLYEGPFHPDALSGSNWWIWSTLVAYNSREFEHVAFHIANEPWHPASWFRNDLRGVSKLRDARDSMRLAGFRGHIGADDNLGRPGDHRYNREYRDLGFWPDYHPWREDADGNDLIPTSAELEDIKRKNPFGTGVFSEPIAFSPWRGGGCCTDNKRLVTRYMERVERLDMMFIYHSTSGLEWPGQQFDWLPGEP